MHRLFPAFYRRSDLERYPSLSTHVISISEPRAMVAVLSLSLAINWLVHF